MEFLEFRFPFRHIYVIKSYRYSRAFIFSLVIAARLCKFSRIIFTRRHSQSRSSSLIKELILLFRSNDTLIFTFRFLTASRNTILPFVNFNCIYRRCMLRLASGIYLFLLFTYVFSLLDTCSRSLIAPRLASSLIASLTSHYVRFGSSFWYIDAEIFSESAAWWWYAFSFAILAFSHNASYWVVLLYTNHDDSRSRISRVSPRREPYYARCRSISKRKYSFYRTCTPLSIGSLILYSHGHFFSRLSSSSFSISHTRDFRINLPLFS